MSQSSAYQLDLFANSVTIRPRQRKSSVTISERDRDSDGRYAGVSDIPDENEVDKLKRQLETERRRNDAVAASLRQKDEMIQSLNEKLKKHGIT